MTVVVPGGFASKRTSRREVALISSLSHVSKMPERTLQTAALVLTRLQATEEVAETWNVKSRHAECTVILVFSL